MVQTSNEQSRETNVEIRGGLKFYKSDKKDHKYKGWYWSYDHKAFFRWDDLKEKTKCK